MNVIFNKSASQMLFARCSIEEISRTNISKYIMLFAVSKFTILFYLNFFSLLLRCNVCNVMYVSG